MRTLCEDVAKGMPMSPEASLVYAYGLYLLNGGTPEGFGQMDEDDIDMMCTAFYATEARRHVVLMEGLADMMQAMFGRKRRWIQAMGRWSSS